MSQRMYWTGLLGGFMVLGAADRAAAQLINGGFEQGGGSLAGWSDFNNSIPNVLIETITPLVGGHVCKIFGGFNGDPNYSGVLQNLPAEAGQLWSATAHVRHNSGDSLAGTPNRLLLKIEFYRVAGGVFGTPDMLVDLTLPVLSGSSPVDVWTEQTLQATAPPDTVEARIALVFENVNFAGGAALVDEVSFETAEPPVVPCDLVWADEFDGDQLNLKDWERMIGNGSLYGLPAGWGNNELQWYTDRPENVFVGDGLLHIVAREEPFAGHDYTSARLRTLNRQDFVYGRMEARIKLPTGQGLWPAFWMMPSESVYGGWAASGELDIMEAVNVPNLVHGTIHYGGSFPANVSSGGVYANGSDFSQDFHDYAVEWEPGQIRWYVDGIFYHIQSSATWYSQGVADPQAPFNQLFHFLLNVAVGGNFPGPPDGTASFPQQMLVDWVRVWSFSDCCIGDLTGDGGVNAADLASLLGAWGVCADCPADLNQDGTVNAADLAVQLGNWGACPG